MKVMKVKVSPYVALTVVGCLMIIGGIVWDAGINPMSVAISGVLVLIVTAAAAMAKASE